MSKTLILLIATVLHSGIIFNSCKNGSFLSETEYPHLLKLDTILAQYNSKREKPDWTSLTVGKVNLVIKEDIVMIDHMPEEGAELITYFLQGTTKN